MVLDLMILEMIQYLVKVVEVKVVINRLLLRILLEVTPLIIQAVVVVVTLAKVVVETVEKEW